MVITLAVMFLMIWTSCSSPKIPKIELHKGKVIIAGHIDKPHNASLVISLNGGKLLGSIRKAAIIDSAGNFRFTFDLLSPQVVILSYENGVAYVFVKPSDSLYIKLNFQDFRKEDHPNFQIEGPTAQISKEIQNYRRFSVKFKESVYYDENEMKLPVDRFLQALKLKIQKGDSLIRIFEKAHHPGKEFGIWAKNDNLYSIANLLVYYMAYRQWHHIPYKHFDNLYDTKIFPVDNDQAIIANLYLHYLYEYVQYRYLALPEVEKLYNEHKDTASVALALSHVLSDEKPGLSRDIMYYKLLLSRKNNPKLFLALMQRPDLYKGNKLLFAEVEEIYKQYMNPEYKTAYFNKFTKKEQMIMGDFLPQLLKKYRGKVIYIDFWEVYCGPCMAEFPYAYELNNKYKGKSVAFVNVCMNSNMNDWTKKIKDMKITGDNYFLNMNQSKIFRSKQKIQGFPTYFIINKNGYIVDHHAPRPSSGKALTDELNKYLKD